jgi:hypothetical protein
MPCNGDTKQGGIIKPSKKGQLKTDCKDAKFK